MTINGLTFPGASSPRVFQLFLSGQATLFFKKMLGEFINSKMNNRNMGTKGEGLDHGVDAPVLFSPLPTFEVSLLPPNPAHTQYLNTLTRLMCFGASTHDRSVRGEFKYRVFEGIVRYNPLHGKPSRGRFNGHKAHCRGSYRKGSTTSTNGHIQTLMNSPPFIFLKGAGA